MDELSHFEQAIKLVQKELASFYSEQSYGEIVITIQKGKVCKVRASKDTLIK